MGVRKCGRVLWQAANHDKADAVADSFFPHRLTVTSEGFGAPESFSFVRQFDARIDDPDNLASPGGFEPPLPP
jgi:hypothetical protein